MKTVALLIIALLSTAALALDWGAIGAGAGAAADQMNRQRGLDQQQQWLDLQERSLERQRQMIELQEKTEQLRQQNEQYELEHARFLRQLEEQSRQSQLKLQQEEQIRLQQVEQYRRQRQAEVANRAAIAKERAERQTPTLNPISKKYDPKAVERVYIEQRRFVTEGMDDDVAFEKAYQQYLATKHLRGKHVRESIGDPTAGPVARADARRKDNETNQDLKRIVEGGGYCNVSDDCIRGLTCSGRTCVKRQGQ